MCIYKDTCFKELAPTMGEYLVSPKSDKEIWQAGDPERSNMAVEFQFLLVGRGQSFVLVSILTD